MKATAASSTNSPARWRRWLLRALTCASFALAMTSCATSTGLSKADPPSQPAPPPPPDVQANQRQPCPPLPLLADDRALSLLALIDASAQQYQDCSDRGDSLVKAMDEWRSTAWSWWCEAARKSGVSVPADRCPAAK